MWFKVDDRLHSHPKALATPLAALGLWALAGSWSGDHLTDGFVTDQAVSQLSRGSNELADELVAAGLWRRVRGGYRFHQWEADGDGNRRNPSRKEVEAERARKAKAGRLGGVASGKARSKKKAGAQARASPVLPEVPNPRPSPSLKREGSGGERAAPLGAPLASTPNPPVAHSPPINGQTPEAAALLTQARMLAKQAAAKTRATSRRRADPLAELAAATQPKPETP